MNVYSICSAAGRQLLAAAATHAVRRAVRRGDRDLPRRRRPAAGPVSAL